MEKDLEKRVVEFCNDRKWLFLLDNEHFLPLALARLKAGSTVEQAVLDAESTLIYNGEA